MLAEVGYDALTMESVSCRAGTTKAAIYRRWPSKAALVADVFATRAQTMIVLPDTGSLRDDLLTHARGVIAALSGEPVGRAVLNLVVAGGSNPDLARLLRVGYLRMRRQVVAQILAAAVARGEIPAGPDAGLAADLLLGPLYYRLLVTGEALDTSIAAVLVDAVMGMVQPGRATLSPTVRMASPSTPA